jgi:hypothetical protein
LCQLSTIQPVGYRFCQLILPASGFGRHETPVPAHFLAFSSATEVRLFQKAQMFWKYACTRLTPKISKNDTKAGNYFPWNRLRNKSANKSGHPSNLNIFTLVGKEIFLIIAVLNCPS